jgi:hypothetical protein
MERLERAVAKLGADDRAVLPDEQRSCCDDLIGCLDDCVDDVAALRKKVRDARR